ncbi:MAG: hypothetical protein R3C11_14090 [Planctomycetaceae bacterium]
MEIIAILLMAIMELFMSLLFMLIPAVLELIAILVQILIEGLIYLGFKRKEEEPVEVEAEIKEQPAVSSLYLFLRKSIKWTAVLGGVTLVLMLVVQFFFLPQVLRLFAGPIEDKTDIRIDFADVEGNLFTGELDIHQLTLRTKVTPQDQDKQYNLAIDQLHLNIDYWNTFWSGTRFEAVDVKQVTGTFTKLEKSKPKEPRHPFVIQDFQIHDLDIQFEDCSREGDPFHSQIKVDSFRSEGFQSKLVLHDFLFNSQLQGSISGHPFEMVTEPASTGTTQKTAWKFESMPVQEFSYYLSGPFELLSSGFVTLQMNSDLSEGDAIRNQDWHIHLEEVRAEVPEETKMSMKLLMTPMVAMLNSINRDFDMQIETELSVSDLHGASAYDATKLSEAFKHAFQVALAQQAREKMGPKADSLRSKFLPGLLNGQGTEEGGNK